MADHIAEDRWLSERLGRPALTVRPDDPAAAAAEVGRHAAAAGRATYQARVPAPEVDALDRLGRVGLRVVSLTLVLGREPGGGAGATMPRGLEVRDADPERDAAVPSIAERSFHASRFHLDPAIPNSVANLIKRDWAESCLAGRRGEQLLVASVDGEPAGFLAVMASEGSGLRLRAIDLIAVAPAHRNRGVGQALVARFLESSAGRCERVRVGTQAANFGATRFYERLGFTLDVATYDLHLHVGSPWAEGWVEPLVTAGIKLH